MPLPADRVRARAPSTPPHGPHARAPRIGIFDSGVGGLSVLRAIRAELPHAELLYVADTGHAPYGERTVEYLCDRSERIARFLTDAGAGIVVVACNTATAAAVAALRGASPDLPLVGVEPGIKPAVALSAARRIGVLATTRTLASDKFQRLAQAHAAGAALVLQACPGLAEAIEAADADDDRLEAMVERYSAPLRAAGVDVAVLGCTHYPFARSLFERALPGVRLIDTADAVARQTARLAADLGPNGPRGAAPALRAWSSGAPQALATFAQRWLGVHVDVQEMRC
ncbi:MAG: glutamate racemase [Burkholderiaceae bacterium]